MNEDKVSIKEQQRDVRLVEEGYPVFAMTLIEREEAGLGYITPEGAKRLIELRKHKDDGKRLTENSWFPPDALLKGLTFEEANKVKAVAEKFIKDGGLKPGKVELLTDKDGGCPTTTVGEALKDFSEAVKSSEPDGEVIATFPPGTLVTKEMLDEATRGPSLEEKASFNKTQGGSRVVPREEWVPEVKEEAKKKREEERRILRLESEHRKMRDVLDALMALQTLEDISDKSIDGRSRATQIRRILIQNLDITYG